MNKPRVMPIGIVLIGLSFFAGLLFNILPILLVVSFASIAALAIIVSTLTPPAILPLFMGGYLWPLLGVCLAFLLLKQSKQSPQ